MQNKRRFIAGVFIAAALVGGVARAQDEAAGDLFDRAPWYVGGGGGYIHFEGNELVNPSGYIALRLGYDFNEWFSTESGLDIMPYLDPTSPTASRSQPLEDATWAFALSQDVLLHLRNAKNLHWDPYVSAGGYLIHYGDDLGESDPQLAINAGAGMFYHFNDMWSVRGDYRSAIAGADTEFNQLITVGVNYRWGAEVAKAYNVSGGQIDSDGDGLLDSEEAQIGTDPFDPDTDKDGLSDGEEVKTYLTDPLNPDSDLDALKDGPEVLTYKSNPLDRDTDKGGVADGHEVIEDNTNPLDPADDLQLFTLNIEFDYDRAELRATDYDELDVIVKVLQRDPGASARIEGHADKRKTSKKDYNIKLSERRAKAVLEYLVSVGGIDRSRLVSKGYGFERPVAPNDTELNMQKNRRTEIYIRRGGEADAGKVTDEVNELPEGTSAPAP